MIDRRRGAAEHRDARYLNRHGDAVAIILLGATGLSSAVIGNASGENHERAFLLLSMTVILTIYLMTVSLLSSGRAKAPSGALRHEPTADADDDAVVFQFVDVSR